MSNSTKPLPEIELVMQDAFPPRIREKLDQALEDVRLEMIANPEKFKRDEPLSEDGIGIHNDLCEICGKDAHHLVCPMKDAAPNDKPCNNCGSPVYYSWGAELYAHEGHRPSLKHRLPTGSDWGKWTDCENPDGLKMGTKAELATVLKGGPAEGIATKPKVMSEIEIAREYGWREGFAAGMREPKAEEPASPVVDLGEVNADAALVWRRRAWDMKRRLDEIAGGSAEWFDVIGRRSL